MNKTTNMRRKDIRWQLLVTVSAAALLASAYGASQAQAASDDKDRPLLWLELGGQLEGMTSPQEEFVPPFMAAITQANLLSALNVQKPPAYAIDEEGKISFQPEDSDWVFSASIRYGRSQAVRHHHQQTKNPYVPIEHFLILGFIPFGGYTAYPKEHVRFADGKSGQSERHDVLDFQAGKDVGLGMFGSRGSSTLSAGVRFAQFSSSAHVTLHAQPDVQYNIKTVTDFSSFLTGFKYVPVQFHGYTAFANNQRNFRGVGPSLTWNASLPFAGDVQNGELTFDWGVNGAVLFGRQKARGHHQTTAQTYHGSRENLQSSRPGNFFGYGKIKGVGFVSVPHPVYQTARDFNRERSVTIPNVGGFAGITYRYTDAKISIGYRADFFFGAIDGGIDTRKSENRGFYGPFASISIGLGD